MRNLSFNYQPPCRHTSSSERGTKIGAVDPVKGTLFEMVEFAVFDELSNTDPASIRHFLVGDNYSNHGMVKLGSGFGQLCEEIGQHGNMAQTVGYTTTVQSIPFNL